MYKRLSLWLSELICKNKDMDKIEKIKFQYGLEIFIINVFTFSIVFLMVLKLSYIKEFAVVFLAFKICRRYAHGIHARTHISCSLVSIFLFAFLPVIIHNLKMDNVLLILISFLYLMVFSLYAPSDTEKSPIIGKKTRQVLRIKAIISVILLMGIAWVIKIQWIRVCIVYGVSIEVIFILPITYKILNQRRNNYENQKKYIGCTM